MYAVTYSFTPSIYLVTYTIMYLFSDLFTHFSINSLIHLRGRVYFVTYCSAICLVTYSSSYSLYCVFIHFVAHLFSHLFIRLVIHISVHTLS